MAVKYDILPSHEWFTGEDRNLDFEILSADPLEDPGASPINISGFTMEWTFADSNQPSATKRIDSHAVTVSGVFNASRVLNTQRARVTILSAETINIEGDKWRYHELTRTNPGSRTVLCFGDAWLCQSPG